MYIFYSIAVTLMGPAGVIFVDLTNICIYNTVDDE